MTWRGTAAFPAHVMITLCFHELVGEEAGSSRSLLDAAHGAETTGRLFLEVATSPGRSCSRVFGIQVLQGEVSIPQGPSGFAGM